MPIRLVPTEVPEVVVVETGIVTDERGFFSETWSAQAYGEQGFHQTFVQDNLSCSRRGTLRGLHYQVEPHGMGKLVRALRGAIYDVAVDLRRGSPWFGKSVGRTLSDENRLSLWVPVGFAHGFLALAEDTLVLYKCTATHAPAAERVIHHADPAIGIAWPEPPRWVASRDATAPTLANAEHRFLYDRRRSPSS
jgi:dTDP-4-dehydrorhamnose 3,5-epimerase